MSGYRWKMPSERKTPPDVPALSDRTDVAEALEARIDSVTSELEVAYAHLEQNIRNHAALSQRWQRIAGANRASPLSFASPSEPENDKAPMEPHIPAAIDYRGNASGQQAKLDAIESELKRIERENARVALENRKYLSAIEAELGPVDTAPHQTEQSELRSLLTLLPRPVALLMLHGAFRGDTRHWIALFAFALLTVVTFLINRSLNIKQRIPPRFSVAEMGAWILSAVAWPY